MKEEHLKPYQQYLEDLTKTFDKIEYTIIPRTQIQFAEALATLASMVEIPEGVWTRSLKIEQSYDLVHRGTTESSFIVDIIFCPPKICVPNPKNLKNTKFLPWGHGNIWIDVA